MGETPHSRKTKKSKKRVSSSLPWNRIVAGIVVASLIAGIAWGISRIPFSSLASIQLTSPAWPPPLGTPEEQLFGTVHESIAPCNDLTRSLPLRRRSSDPLVRLTNIRYSQMTNVEYMLLSHAKTPSEAEKLRAKAISAQTVVAAQPTSQTVGGFPDPFNSRSTVIHIDIIPEIWDEPCQLFLRFRMSGGGGFQTWDKYRPPTLRVGQAYTFDLMLPPTLPGFRTPTAEIFVTVADDRYRVTDTTNSVSEAKGSQPLQFKVSTSIVSDTGRIISSPREWHPEELKLLTSSGGQISIDYTGYSGVVRPGNVVPSPVTVSPIGESNAPQIVTGAPSASAPAPTVTMPTAPITLPAPPTTTPAAQPGKKPLGF